MPTRRILSTVRDDRVVELSIAEASVRAPGPDDVVIRVDAAPINPSDLGTMFGPADLTTARVDGNGRLLVDIPERAWGSVAARAGTPVPVGNEGAGEVVDAGSSPAAQALLGRTVAFVGGGMYADLRLAPADQCLPLPPGVTAEQGASCFVNPLTALGMVETMRLEGHHAIVHTAAASNLGQMLVELCRIDDVPLVNIVRRGEQVDLLRDLGATHVCNSSDDDFRGALVDAVAATDATLGFDATGGGTLAGTILDAMERAQARASSPSGRYGTMRHKQVYLYGGLDRSPTRLDRTYGMAWGVGGWVLPNFLARIGRERADALRSRVAEEITTTFASHYSARISLADVLSPDVVARYGTPSTGDKHLVTPTGA